MSIAEKPRRITHLHLSPRLAWALILLPLLVLGLLVGLALAAWGGDAPGPTTEPPTSPATPTPTTGETMWAEHSPASAPAPEREAAESPAEPAVAAADFPTLVERLVDLGETTTALAQADEFAQAKASDEAARRSFAALLQQFDDAGERALDLLTTMPGASTLPRDTARRFVLQLVLAADCARRHDAAVAAADHTRIDALVHAALAILPQNAPLAELGGTVLGKRPFLRLCHEAAVLGLVQLAGQEQFPRAVATTLLLTLWDNLQSSGERSSAEFASLAMVLLGDGDPSKRTAACRHLVTDPRYRPLVLAWLREHRDHAVAAEVGNLAARELPPADALQVLRELGPILGTMPSAYMALGFRAPETLADSYRELLAQNSQPAQRSDLIAGLAMAEASAALPAVELAQATDPAPAVRLQAMLTLSARAAVTHGEAACQRALDDPAIGTNPTHLQVVVFALQNLEAAGLTNAVDRLGQRLRATPLRDDTRVLLEQLLRRALPDGQTSDGQTSDGRRFGPANRPGGTPR